MRVALLLTALLGLGTTFSVTAVPPQGQQGGARAMVLDTNRDGGISLEEYLTKPREAFKRADADGDGFITATELASVEDRRRSAIRDQMTKQARPAK